MNFNIKRFQEKHRASWESFIERSNNGTLFHERRFLSYHPKERFVDHSLLIEKKGKLLAVLPAAEQTINGKKWLVSHPGASYGGFVHLGDLAFRDSYTLVEKTLEYCTQSGFAGIRLTLVPAIYQRKVSNYLDFTLVKHGFVYSKREISSILNIEPSPEINLGLFKPTHRTAVRKAKKLGVTIKESNEWAEFYALLKQNLGVRHGVQPTHSLEELIALKELYPERIRLFGAFWEGKMVAGVVNFSANRDVVLAFYISHREEFQHLRAVNLLFYEVISWCHENSYKYLDFGIFTVNMEPNFGLGRFKENFGAGGIFRDTFEYEF